MRQLNKKIKTEMKKKLVSVVIPSYNEEKDIKGCIKTLLSQSYKSIEIIVVDDGSTDNTYKILKNFEKKNKNIRIFKQKHQGPGRARNFGAKKANGKILIFIDADMEFHKDYVKKLVTPILENKTFGTIHTKEYILNRENLWARFFGERLVVDSEGKGRIFRAIRKKEFFKYGPFDSELGYADDQTIFRKTGIKSLPTTAICYHKNPFSLKEVYRQSVWIGASYEFKVLDIPILNFIAVLVFILIAPPYIFYLTIRKIYENKDFEYILYPIFAIAKYAGTFAGILKKIFLRKKVK